jgi:putative phage-type endonuclease
MQHIKVDLNALAKNEADFVESRRHSLGGSDAAVLVGCPFNADYTPLQLYYSKVDEPEAKDLSNFLMVKKRREDQLLIELAIYLKLHQPKYADAEVFSNIPTFKHPDYPFLHANIDGMLAMPNGDEIGIEIKTQNAFAKDKWDKGVPEYIQMQVQHYMLVTGMTVFLVWVEFSHGEFSLLEIQANSYWQDLILKRSKDFWSNHVETLTPPPPSTKKELSLTAPAYSEPKIASAEDIDLIAQINKAKAAKKKAASEQLKAETKLAESLKDNPVLTDAQGNCLVTYKAGKTGRRINIKKEKAA